MALTGIDASRHQGDPDWARVAGSGKEFAFIKATDGVAYRYVDWFHRNAPRVRAAGLVLGAYHFLLDHHPGAAQARFYVDEVNKAGGFRGVVPIVDIEREADGTTPRESHLRDFVGEFRRLVPSRPILIYTGRWYWVGVLGNPRGVDLGPLWHSEYDGRTPLDQEVADGPELDGYGGWTDCLVWQHTSTGSCPGIAGHCDLNLFYGTASQLRTQLAGAGPQPAPPVPEEDDEMKIARCVGRKTLLIGGPAGIQELDADEKAALLKVGVKETVVTDDEWVALSGLAEDLTERLNAAPDAVITVHNAVEDSALRQLVRSELAKAATARPATA